MGHTTPPSLLIRLRDAQDRQSWQQFFEQYWRLIYSFARECGFQPEESQDVVQEVVTEVFKAMPGFEYDRTKGTFRGFLRTITQRKLIDHLGRKSRRPAATIHSSTNGNGVHSIADPSTPSASEIWEVNWNRNLLQVCLDRVRQEVEPKTYQAFQLYVLDEWTPKGTAEFLQINVASVYAAKSRVIERLRHWFEIELSQEPEP